MGVQVPVSGIPWQLRMIASRVVRATLHRRRGRAQWTGSFDTPYFYSPFASTPSPINIHRALANIDANQPYDVFDGRYDVALWATIADFPYSWPLWQRYSSKFVATQLVRQRQRVFSAFFDGSEQAQNPLALTFEYKYKNSKHVPYFIELNEAVVPEIVSLSDSCTVLSSALPGERS